MSPPYVKNKENQALIDALNELADAIDQDNDSKATYKARSIRNAVQNLAELTHKITSGKKLAESGPNKVKGVGKGTAYYIDEFLEKGKIVETKELQKKQKSSARATHVTPERASRSDSDTIQINRAPVLTLWVVVVAEKQGFNKNEAHSYGRYIAGILAQSKGRSLGIFEERDADEHKQKKQRTTKDYVHFFQHIKVPVQVMSNGDRVAYESGSDTKTIDPKSVENYLERAFGNRLVDVKEAMEMLANSMSDEDLKKQAYTLYEQIRPEWKGWGQKSALSLSKICQLAEEKK
jgi:hypothetical protein